MTKSVLEAPAGEKIKKKREKPFHIAKREGVGILYSLTVRVVAVLLSILSLLIIIKLIDKSGFGLAWKKLFVGAFGEGLSASTTANEMFKSMMILLVLALGLAPAFKMKFWNIGAQGQALIGNLCSSMVVYYLGGKMPDGVLIPLAFIAAVLGAGIWAALPAIAKVKLRANETLFTLMMNYIAIQLVFCFVDLWKGKAVSLSPFANGKFPSVFGNVYGLTYLIVAIVTVAMWIYLKKSKHGYEISVVGESINTARYAGINTAKVIIRTVFISGAICGIAGFLHTGNESMLETVSDGNYGFTAIIVAWSAHFNPIAMVLIAFFIVFLQKGATGIVNTNSNLNEFFAYILVGVFLFFLIGSEFFLNYKFVWSERITKWFDEHMPRTRAFMAKSRSWLSDKRHKFDKFKENSIMETRGFFDRLFGKDKDNSNGGEGGTK